MDTTHLAKSLQNILQISNLCNSTQSKSLPNIFIPLATEEQLNFNPNQSVKKHKQKILKKTWDKVKTAIIHTTTSHSYRRGSLKNKLDKSPTNNSSAPSTPLHKQSFDFDTPSHRLGAGASTTTPTPAPSNSNELLRSLSASPYSAMKSFDDPEKSDVEEECEKIQRNYAQLQKRLSEELHQRMSECKDKPDPKHATDQLSEDFKKKLRQWEMWKLSTGKVTYTDEELQQLLPQDFSKKLQEWECIKTSGRNSYGGAGHHSKTPDSGGSHNTRDTSSPEVPTNSKSKLLRKKKNSDSSRQKELAWLEKQLEKIEVEKRRLEREMKKYMEREARLEKMKEALQNTSPTEVWIRTPTAKCKVEKLTEKFTKKLYEWEEKQGIQPESSTMALLAHPQYYEYGPLQDEHDEEIESRVQADFNATRYDDDTPAVSSVSRDSESRHDCDACEEEMVQDPVDQEEVERRVSSASSSDFEEATDSFATHDKGNSGASNTDSDFYRAEFPCSRRRSSEAISTPLSATSPPLSAFTSDDEGEMCGLLKTVSEENENTNTLKDAESQTEVIRKAKPVVVEDDEDNEESLADDSQAGIFVPTKRTIFTPILDDKTEPEKVVLISQDLKSPAMIKTILQSVEKRPVSPTVRVEPCEPSSKLYSVQKPSITSSNPPSPSLPRPPPPRVVEMTPKIPSYNPISQSQIPQRSFPKMGKIWCSPLAIRRHLGAGGSSASVMGLGDWTPTSRAHSSSVDFSIDRFLLDSNILDKQVPCCSTSMSSASTSKIPVTRAGRRNTSAAVPEERQSGIIGAGIQTGQRHPAFIRSSSFRFRRDSDNGATLRPDGSERKEETPKGLYAQIRNRVGLAAVTKSQSTGSIKRKLGKAFSGLTGRTKEQDNSVQAAASVCKKSGGD